MHAHRLITAPTFVLARSIEFLARFPPCRGDFVLAKDRLTGVFAVGGTAVPYTVAAGTGGLVVETEEPAVVPMAAAMLGVDDDLTGFYDKADEVAIAWNDPAIGIAWPIATPTLSAKDQAAPPLSALHDRSPR